MIYSYCYLLEIFVTRHELVTCRPKYSKLIHVFGTKLDEFFVNSQLAAQAYKL